MIKNNNNNMGGGAKIIIIIIIITIIIMMIIRSKHISNRMKKVIFWIQITNTKLLRDKNIYIFFNA